MNHILTLLIFIPVLFGILLLLLPASVRNSYKYIALAATLIQLVLSGWLYFNFKTGTSFSGINHESQYQFSEKASWISLNL
ncbi:MAG: NADH-quinone oxidoreductase subunit M, partial [Sphingobacteriaceae bacterium]